MKKAIAMSLCGAMCLTMLAGCSNKEDLEQIEKLEKKNDKLNDEIDELEDEINDLKKEKSDLEDENDYLKDILDSYGIWYGEDDYDDVEDPSEPGEEAYDPWVEAEPEVVSPYPLYTDSDGNVIDLGGMEIIIRDWWSGWDTPEPTNEYEEALAEYREWIQETYNFTIKQIGISDWGSTPSDFTDYVTSGGDDCNYAWVLREDPTVAYVMIQGLMYDLSSLDCLDFSDSKFQRNKTYEQYTYKGNIYAMSTGYSYSRTGVFFNKQVLEDAGIEPDDLYDKQANGTWTWDAFETMMDKCQRDTDNDGLYDIYGFSCNESNFVSAAVYSNGGEFVGKDGDSYYCALYDYDTYEAMMWADEVINRYDNHDPEGANWDYYKEEFLSGRVAFLVDDAYNAESYGFLSDAEFEVGFVMFPKGPEADTYVNCWSSNPVAIPACYDEERAWKIAFAYNLYTEEPEGYEDYLNLSSYRNGILDSRAIDETLTMMSLPEYGMITYHNMIPNLQIGADLLWYFMPYSDVYSYIDNAYYLWTGYVNSVN